MKNPNFINMKIKLTARQKTKPELLQHPSSDHHVRNICCVLLSPEVWSTSMTTQSRRIHESTVLRHISDYLRSEKLSPEKGSSDNLLSVIQTAELIEHLTNNLLPVAQAVIEPVDKQWGNGWMPDGKKVHMVKTTNSRTRLNFMHALNLSDISSTVVREYGTLNKNIAQFFTAIHETYPITQKVHIIPDGVGYHHAELMKDRVYVMNIDPHYLPTYSPNLNPYNKGCGK